MTYDRETNQIVMQDSRVWIAGLGDEGGAGSWLAAVMKELVEPDKEELDKLQQFVDGVLWGGLQYKEGPKVSTVCERVSSTTSPTKCRRDYYRGDFDWTSWTSWNKKHRKRSTVLTTIPTWRRRTGSSIVWRATIRGSSRIILGTGISRTPTRRQWP